MTENQTTRTSMTDLLYDLSGGRVRVYASLTHEAERKKASLPS